MTNSELAISMIKKDIEETEKRFREEQQLYILHHQLELEENAREYKSLVEEVELHQQQQIHQIMQILLDQQNQQIIEQYLNNNTIII